MCMSMMAGRRTWLTFFLVVFRELGLESMGSIRGWSTRRLAVVRHIITSPKFKSPLSGSISLRSTRADGKKKTTLFYKIRKQVVVRVRLLYKYDNKLPYSQ